MTRRLLAFAILLSILAGSGALVGTRPALAQTPPGPPDAHIAKTHGPVCGGPVPHGAARCNAQVRTDAAAHSAVPKPRRSVPGVSPEGANPYGSTIGSNGAYDPSYLQSAYNLAQISMTSGVGKTVAIVDAYDGPSIESDLAYYRSYFGLPPCSSANGCFRKLNQAGATGPYPQMDGAWAEEIALDLDMVSAICPNCKIVLVEADSSNITDLGAAVNTAARLGAVAISNSYGGWEYSGETADEASFYNHPGILITASSGDYGYGVQFPAASQYVTAVGGTSLVQATNSGTRSATETVWSGAGSGCSFFEPKPSWQHDTGCGLRTVSDVSAVADPNSGVWIYSYQNWWVVGGTSVASPIVASIYALAGVTVGSGYPHPTSSSVFDITSGSNGSCGTYLCTGEVGFDGPSGVGTPNGTAIFTVTANGAGPAVANIGPVSGPVAGGTAVTVNGSGFAVGTSGTSFSFGANTAAQVSCGSTSSCTVTSPAGQPGVVDVKATVGGMTSATSSADQFTYVAAAAPTVTSISPASGPSAGGTSVTINGTGFSTAGGGTGANFGSTAGSNVRCGSTTQCTATSPAGSGTVDVTVAVGTAASATSAADQFSYTAPTLAGISPASGPSAGGTGVILTGSGFSTATGVTAVSFGGVAAATVKCGNTTQCTATSPAGSGIVNVTLSVGGAAAVAGAAGSVTPSSTDQFTYMPPAVTGISPTSGPAGGGTSVTIKGSGFGTAAGATSISFGSVAATNVKCGSTSQCTAAGPAGSGVVDVTVTVAGLTSATSSADQFTYIVPAVTSISPTSGPSAGGTKVTIKGAGFSQTTGATSVSFGAAAGTQVSCSSTQCTAVGPAGSGTVDVTVTVAGVTSATSAADQFSYTPPAVTSISPASGPSAGGTTVTVNGSGFSQATGATGISFGGVAATNVKCGHTNQCTATSPAGSGVVDVTVTAGGATSVTSVADRFTYGP